MNKLSTIRIKEGCIPIIIGPTAIGKTRFSIEMALNSGRDIVSADSMQVYRLMDIGTAKPDKAELSQVKHHLINIRMPDEEWNLHSFLQAVEELNLKPEKHMIVGGTGLYIRALIQEFQMPNITSDPKLRVSLRDRMLSEGLNSLYAELKVVDPVSAETIHPNDEYRIIRALEVFYSSGKPLSTLRGHRSTQSDRYQLICLHADRAIVYQRIERRVHNMFEKGLIDEVRMLLDKGYDPELSSLQALGYKEVIQHLKGELNYEETIELVKIRTRHFARRQLTWYRRFKNTDWIDILTDLDLPDHII